MTCDCVKEEIAVLQAQNKTLRTANKQLREAIRLIKLEADELFVTLCDTDSSLVELIEAIETDTDVNEL